MFTLIFCINGRVLNSKNKIKSGFSTRSKSMKGGGVKILILELSKSLETGRNGHFRTAFCTGLKLL